MISIRSLEKAFGRQKVLKGINIEMSPGRIYAILGHNASGKTTLIKSLLGLVIPDKGEILVGGKSVRNDYKYRKQFGYMSQIARFPQNITMRELFSMIGDLRKSRFSFEGLTELFGLNTDLDRKLGHLSGGTRQKVNVVAALMLRPEVLVCDEPTVGLDPASVIKLKRLLLEERAAGRTIIVITHIISLVEEISDYVFLLQDGNLDFSGTVDELKTRENQPDLEEALAALMERKSKN